MIDAPIKYKMNHGKIFLKEKSVPPEPDFLAFLVRIKARINVIGIIAKVLVSLTVTAADRIPSQL